MPDNEILSTTVQWQDRALLAEASELDLMRTLAALRKENDQLKRRLASSEAELNVAVDKLEAAATRISFLERERITDTEVDRLYGDPPRR